MLRCLELLIGSAVTLVSDFVQMILVNIPLLLDAGFQILQVSLTAIFENLPLLVECAVSLVMQLVTAILENLPLLIDCALGLVEKVIKMAKAQYIKHLYENEGKSKNEIRRITGLNYRIVCRYVEKTDWNEKREPNMGAEHYPILGEYTTTNNGQNGATGDIIIPIYIEGEQIQSAVISAIQLENMRSGGGTV